MKSGTANIDMFHPEAKWSSLSSRDQILRSIAAHIGLAVPVFILALSNGSVSKPLERNSIQFELVTAAQSPVATLPNEASQLSPVRTPVDDLSQSSSALTSNVLDPNGRTERPPEMTSPTTRPGDSVNEKRQTGQPLLAYHQPITVPLTSASQASSPKPSSESIGHKTVPISMTTAGKGANSFGAPKNSLRPGPHTRLSLEFPAGISMASSPNGYLKIDNGPGTAPSIVASVPKETFAQLDSRACAAFYRGERIGAARPEEAKALWLEAAALMDRAIPLLASEQGTDNSEMASALRNVGRCYDKLHDPAKAAEYHRQSADLYKKVEGESSREFAVAMVYYADALIEKNDLSLAEEALLQSLPIYKQIYGENSQYVAWTYQRLAKISARTERQTESTRYSQLANEILTK
jgi:hypothetical protein